MVNIVVGQKKIAGVETAFAAEGQTGLTSFREISYTQQHVANYCDRQLKIVGSHFQIGRVSTDRDHLLTRSIFGN